ncbi:MAG: TLD domain-containing protein [archaeon]|nr:TLD domain-containing protein [archaeon]
MENFRASNEIPQSMQMNPQMNYNESEASLMSTLVTSDPIVCTQCGSSIDIDYIKMEDGEYKMTFKCQNDHTIEDQSLIEYMSSQQKESKENTSCNTHNGEKYVAYCTKCQKNLCFECAVEDEHMEEEGVILNYPQIFPARKQMKEFIQEKTKELEELEAAKTKVINWLDKMKERMEKLFQSQQALIEFQKAFVEHFKIKNLNYTKIKSLNYLMSKLKYHKETPNLKDNTFDDNFKPLEQKIFDNIGLEGPIKEEAEDEKEKEKGKGKPKENEEKGKKLLKAGKPEPANKTKERGKSKEKETPSKSSSNSRMKAAEKDSNEKSGDEEEEDGDTITLKDLGSNIIKRENDLKNLLDFFPEKPKGLKRLYSAFEDDGSAASFHQKCDKKGPTLVLIKPSYGSVIGGYTSKPWALRAGHMNDNFSFVFNLDKKRKFPASTGNGIFCDDSMGPIFEGANTTVLEISDNATTEKSSVSRYGNEDDFGGANLQNERRVGDETTFRVNDYEVFQVV